MKRIIALFLILALVLSGCSPVRYAVPETTAATTAAASEPDYLETHFLDVGQADCALILCGGQAMLIDGGNAADSSYVVAYLKNLGVGRIDYMICTHAHEDHAGGLSGPLNSCEVGKVYAPQASYDSKAFSDFTHYVAEQGLEITLPAPGEEFALGGATVRILAPLGEYENTNDTSVVLRVDFGETSLLFTGDAERAAEQDLLDSGAPLASTLLKVGHHGSNTSTGYRFLREIMPTYAVIQVGEGNDYGHPSEDVLSRLYDADVTVYRTDLNGAVIARSDGVGFEFTIEKGVSAPGRSEYGITDTEAAYIGNAKSKVFHNISCKNLPTEANRVFFGNRQAAVASGYKPCGNCNP